MRRVKLSLTALIWVSLAIFGAGVRLAFMSSSTGPDPIQFHSFGVLFLKYGLNFYSVASHSNPKPFGWSYPYPPLWGLYLALAVMIYGTQPPYKSWWIGTNYRVVVDPTWVSLVKIPLVISDLVIALLLLLMFSDRNKGVVASLAWLLNPMTIYISSIFGMFDTLATLFLMAGLLFTLKKRFILSGALMGVALMVKQHVLFAVLPIIIYFLLADRKAFRDLLASLLIIVLVVSAPFILLSGDPVHTATNYLETIAYSGNPYYPVPLCYSFNGLFSTLTYIHLKMGIDTLWIFRYWILIWAALFSLVLYRIFKGRIGLFQAAFLGYLTFLAAFWRINHQYLVPMIALMAPMLMERRGFEGVLRLILYMLAAAWVFMFPIAFWFWVYMPNTHTPIREIMETLSLHVFGDRNYVLYSLTLWISEILLIIFSRSKIKSLYAFGTTDDYG